MKLPCCGVTPRSSLRPRLNVVKIPVRREDACKPTLLPDGRTVYRCTYCSKDFGSFSDINRHMDFHEGRGKFHFSLFFSLVKKTA